MFTVEQQRDLLRLARTAVTNAVHGYQPRVPDDIEDSLRQPYGAFVTLKSGASLRGCIGFPEAVYPLCETIVRCGISAALQDPRFHPVSPAELANLRIEISILSPLTAVKPDEVIVGTHGLVIERGSARGLLLPQVPVEWGWNRDEFLAHTCRKAGLPPDAWRSGAKLYAFTAEVFAEEDPPEHTA